MHCRSVLSIWPSSSITIYPVYDLELRFKAIFCFKSSNFDISVNNVGHFDIQYDHLLVSYDKTDWSASLSSYSSLSSLQSPTKCSSLSSPSSSRTSWPSTWSRTRPGHRHHTILFDIWCWPVHLHLARDDSYLFCRQPTYNYSRWMVRYYLNLLNMDETHPGVKECSLWPEKTKRLDKSTPITQLQECFLPISLSAVTWPISCWKPCWACHILCTWKGLSWVLGC